MILPSPFAVLVLESETGSIRFHEALAALEHQPQPSWAGWLIDALRGTRTDIPDDDTATWGRAFWFRIEGDQGDLPREPCPGIRLYRPGDDAPVSTDPRTVHDAQMIMGPVLRRFLGSLEGDPTPEPEEIGSPTEPDLTDEPDLPEGPIVVDVPEIRWSLLTDEQIDSLEDDQIYGWIMTFERDYGIRPPRNVELLPIADLRGWIRETARSDRVRETQERRRAETARQNELAPPYNSLFTTTTRGGVKLDFQAIADVIIARYEPITFNRQTWIYVDGLYQREQGEILSYTAEVARAAGFEGSITAAAREITAYVAAHDIVTIYPFDRFPDALPLENGVLCINWEMESVTLHPYAPMFRFTHRWPVSYDPDADPGPVDQVLGSYVADQEVPALLQLPAQAILQFLGFGPFKKSYIFEGPTNGGKSTYVEHFLNRLFGAENISGVSLQEIGFSRFVTGSLENKILNRCDDLADIPLRNVGPFKTLTGGFSHQIERKHEKDYPGKISAVHVFATNMPPEVPENVLFDSAFWARFIYLRFNNCFEVDPSFCDRVLTPTNMSGALNRILTEMFTIRGDGRLSFDQDPGGVKDEWQTAANPFQRFVASEMDTSNEPVRFDKGKLFRCFLGWCNEEQISPRKVPGSMTGFTQMIFGSGFKPVRRGKREEREQMYEGKYAWKRSSTYREMI